MAGGKDVGDGLLPIRRPFLIARRNLGGDDGATVLDLLPQHLANQTLAVTVAVRQRRIEERHALIERRAQRLASITIVDAAPLAATKAPSTVPDLTDLVSGDAEPAVRHAVWSPGSYARRSSGTRQAATPIANAVMIPPAATAHGAP